MIEDALGLLWQIIKVISTIVSVVAIPFFLYSFIRLHEVRKEEEKQLAKIFTRRAEVKKKSDRWDKVEGYLASEHSSDWKIAILEADSMLDDVIKDLGYVGETMGDRMKQIDTKTFPLLSEAWNVHKIRNQIAHRGSEYPITRTEADDTIDKYKRIFTQLNVL